ncbi:AMP deaminase putative / myoadenylate deaminase putative [Euphorbia peplus]|nr:AMP deaminase putative / myoadenylate deaminase putative [Euphorbia peplus]
MLCVVIFEPLVQGGEHIYFTPNGEQFPIPASSMILSHSVSGDLHGVQPDPIAADILRKEPEHETFARLKIASLGIDCLLFVLVLNISISLR